jgi:hypothetical protein
MFFGLVDWIYWQFVTIITNQWLASFLTGLRASAPQLRRMTNDESMLARWTHSVLLLLNFLTNLMLRPTVSRPVLSWNKAPIWGVRPDCYYCQRVANFLMWGAISDERTNLSFTIVAGPPQRSHSRVRVLLELATIFYDSQGYGRGIQPRLHTG